jgi:hypothetical protein
VNTYTAGSQSFPDVAVDGSGTFVVVWYSDAQDGHDRGVFARLFDSSGAPATGDQEQPKVAMDGAGGFMVVWTDLEQDPPQGGVFGQRFDSSGASVGAEFQVNAYTTGVQDFPEIASNASGDFVVVWESLYQDGDGKGIFGRRFDSAGAFLGVELQINTYTGDNQLDPAVAVDPNGGFVVVWGSVTQGGIFGQRFDSTGADLGGEFQASTYTTQAPARPEVAMDDTGAFLVAWETDGQDGSGAGIFAQAFDSAGGAVGSEFQVNTSTSSHQDYPSVAFGPAGEFVVLWESLDQDGDDWGVFGQSLDVAGAPLGGEFQINSFAQDKQQVPRIATDDLGNSMAVWASFLQDGSIFGVVGRRLCPDMDVDGVCNDDDVFLTSPAEMDTLDCSDPRLTRPTFTWEMGNYDRFKVFMGYSPGFEKGTRVTSGDRFIKTGSWEPSKKKWRKACRKALAGNALNPVLYIRVLGKDRDVRKKDPARKTFSQTVQVDITP